MYKIKESSNGNKILELNGLTIAVISACDHNEITALIEKANQNKITEECNGHNI